MNDGAYAGLRLAARASEPESDPNNNEPEDDCAEGEKKEPKMDKTHTQEDLDKAASAAAKAASDRFSAVLASEHYAGREALGQKLLGNDKLSAEDIVDMLQAAEKKPEPQASADDGPDMLAQMRAGADPDLGTEGGDDLGAKADNYGWGKAVAKAQKLSGIKPKG